MTFVYGRLMVIELWLQRDIQKTSMQRLLNDVTIWLKYNINATSYYGQTVVIKRWLDYDNKITSKQRLVNDVTIRL